MAAEHQKFIHFNLLRNISTKHQSDKTVSRTARLTWVLTAVVICTLLINVKFVKKNKFLSKTNRQTDRQKCKTNNDISLC